MQPVSTTPLKNTQRPKNNAMQLVSTTSLKNTQGLQTKNTHRPENNALRLVYIIPSKKIQRPKNNVVQLLFTLSSKKTYNYESVANLLAVIVYPKGREATTLGCSGVQKY